MQERHTDPFELNGIFVEPETNCVGGTRIDDKSMQVLLCLKEAAPNPLKTTDLLERVWPDVVVNDNVVHQALAHLRKAFGDDPKAPRFIETIPKKGYRLIGAPGGDAQSHNARVFSMPLIIGATVLTVIALSLAFWPSSINKAAPGTVRVAVLPFDNVAPEQTPAYLPVSISDAVWQKLAGLTGVELISPRSAEIAKQSDMDMPEIARALDADYILEGSVNSDGRRLRVSAHLIDGNANTDVWQNTFDSVLSGSNDYFDLYDEIAGKVTGSFPFGFENPLPEIESGAPDLLAYELVQQAWYQPVGPARAIELCQEARRIDPSYARAAALEAFYWAAMAEWRLMYPREGFTNARRAAEEALNLDPENALAYATLGAVYDRIDLDFGRAFTAYERAEALGATELEMSWKQDTLLNAGRYDAGLEVTQEMERLSPLDGAPKVFTARLLYRKGQVEEAIQKMDEALDLYLLGDKLVAENALAFFYFHIGDVDKVERLIEDLELTGDLLNFWKAMVEVERGNPEGLKDILRSIEASTSGYVDPIVMSNGYIVLGEFGQHMEWTKKRIADRANVPWLLDIMRVNPDYWDRMSEWAESDVAERENRFAQIDEHRKLIQEISTRLTL